MLRLQTFGLSVSLLLLILSLGCGSGSTRVEGNVKFDGQPIEQGTIVFEPADGNGTVVGGTIRNGYYMLGKDLQLAPGNKLVRIKAMRATGKKVKAGPPAPDDAMVDEVQQYIPARYNDQSTLTTDLVGGNMTKDFELTSQP